MTKNYSNSNRLRRTKIFIYLFWHKRPGKKICMILFFSYSRYTSLYICYLSALFSMLYIYVSLLALRKKSKTKSNPTDLFFSCRVVAAIGLLMIVVAAAAVACRFQLFLVYFVVVVDVGRQLLYCTVWVEGKYLRSGRVDGEEEEEIQNNKNICVCL